jgi:hypothetical protein
LRSLLGRLASASAGGRLLLAGLRRMDYCGSVWTFGLGRGLSRRRSRGAFLGAGVGPGPGGGVWVEGVMGSVWRCIFFFFFVLGC